MSNPGEPYRAALPRDQRVLGLLADSGHETGAIVIMGRRDSHAFYRIGAECFATGLALSTTQSFGQVACSRVFPSAARPILDFTVFHAPGAGDKGRPTTLTVHRSDGFAADGVAKVAFVDDAGNVVAETAVVDNTYVFDPPPSGVNLRIVAFNTAGERIFEQPKRGSTR